MARGARLPRPAPAAAAALLVLMAVSCAAIEHLAPGVCPSIDIRNSPEHMYKLNGCRVIEGQLTIVLMERTTTQTFENMSFPELREVTGYILIYRLKGIRNLGDLFPNLSVVRGMQLYKDYSIVIFDNEHLESLGLRSLTVIQRGAVRIQHNDRLCYVDTIDWTRIMADEGADNNVIRSNYDTRLCGLCPNAQSRTDDHTEANMCPTDSTHKLLCWDEKHCQRVCPSKCEDRACTKDNVCCHSSCLGGCDGPTASDCHVCKGYSFQYGKQRKCVDRCPRNTYELYWRCVSEQECRSMPPPFAVGHETQSRPAPNIRAYKILNNKSCVFYCPSGYIETGDARNASCQPCGASGCVRECAGGRVDSVAAAEQFRGCTHVKGTLELALRASRSNTMAILEASLGEIREIEGCLKVVRSYPLVSLMFLKNLRKIVGSPDVEKSQALHIFNNPNLELLWDWSIHQPISIASGTLYIHFNPKLCNNQIMPLKNMTKDGTATFNEVDISDNGDQATCFQETLDLQVSELSKHVAVLAWNMFCVDDLRKLLGFSIYYIQADRNVTLYEHRDACSDTWNVLDIPREEVHNNSRIVPENATSILGNPCNGIQPLFRPVTQLTPFTRYAAYVKAFTTSQDKKGAQSPIIYFQTLPTRPSPPLSINVEIESAHSVNIKWSPPTMPNGTITLYHVEIQANSYNRPKIIATNINHCANPSALSNNIVFKSEEQTMKEKDESITGDVSKMGTCACKEDEKIETRFTHRAEEEANDNIQFENSLQNMVYLKNSVNRTAKTANKSGTSRIKRSINNSLNNMLVILSENSHPQWGLNYTNSTDDEDYVKSLYYQLDGNTRTLSVDNMKHFTWYTVNIWACRVRHPNETESVYKENWCSVRAFNTFRTLELVNADTVSNLQAYIIPSNKTLPEVNMTWEPPKKPNGFVVAYNVHYSKVEDNGQTQDVGLASCVNSDDFEANGRSYQLKNLLAGNYSLKVTPITIKGAGNTSDVSIFIPERTIDSGHEWIWAVIGGCVITLGVVGGGVWYVRRGLLPGGEANKLFASVNPEYVSTVYVPDEWEVPRASVEFIRELGQGSFGMVYEGLAKNMQKGIPETRCAVKTVNEHATDRERIEFLKEASVMKAFDTFHVVRLLGVVSRGQPTLVIMELMQRGDLKTYLRSHRPDAEPCPPRKPGDETPSLQSILQMAIEIADGMAYLSAKKFVHRDLAARNCMVAGDLTVKVGDFGMTRDIYETDYYRKGSKGLLPVRWMSPESLKDGVFSSNSDVWSFGVVLWEMATLAMQPYQGLSNEQVLRYVVEGGVIERPEHCPDRLYELMRACWAHRPAARPSFLQLVADLSATAQPYFRHRSFFHTPQGQEMYALQRAAMEESGSVSEVNVGAVATGSGSNLFGVSGRLASWVRELSSLRSRPPDAAAEPLQPVRDKGPNGIIREPQDAEATGC